MGLRDDLEWCMLGARLAALCPEKFTEILDALRGTVGAHEILAPNAWMMRAGPQRSIDLEKS